MIFLYILLPLAIIFSFIFFGLWMREKRERADEKYDREHQEELGTAVEKEKNALKKKITETEKSLREAEGKKGALLLELEKEKAKEGSWKR